MTRCGRTTAVPPHRKVQWLIVVIIIFFTAAATVFQRRLARWCAQVARQRRAPTISAAATPFAEEGRRTLRHIYMCVYALCYYCSYQ